MFEQHELTHKPGARLQYCTRVRWHSVVFVHELRHTNQELDCSTGVRFIFDKLLLQTSVNFCSCIYNFLSGLNFRYKSRSLGARTMLMYNPY